MERGKNVMRQTSLAIDPPDGRIPPLAAEGQRWFAQMTTRNNVRPGVYSPSSHEDRSNTTRCLRAGQSG
jgi:hypothetical protein